VDMDKLKSLVNNFDNQEGGIIIVVTTDCTESIHCKCAPLDLDKGAEQTYMKIYDLTNTICQEEKIFKKEIVTYKKKLKELLASNYNKGLSSLALEHCLLYFCMFPRHHLVRWNLLVRMYEAEGIDIYNKDNEEHLKIFIDHHAVHVSKNGELKRCQFPVMMLNHISDESNSNNFFTSSCGSMDTPASDSRDPVRRHSLHQISGENDKLKLPEKREYRSLRTLAVFHTGSILNFSKLFKYKLLRVLDMRECPLSLTSNELRKICNLLLLKYLSLGGTVKDIPRDIAKLQWLETLAMKKTEIVCVPVELMELPRLKHLLGKFQLVQGDINKKKLRQLLKTDSLLQCLSGFVIGADSKEFGELMNRMKNLQKVKIWCDAKYWTGHVTAAIKRFTREDTQRTRSLSIECDSYPSEIVEFLEHHGTLTSLKLCGDLKILLGCQVDRPIVQVLELKKIGSLCLSGTNLSGTEIVSVLKHFLALIYLKLVEDKLGVIEIPVDSLYTLSQLRLVAVSNLHRVIISEDSVLRCLVSLDLLVNTQCDLSGIDINKLTKLKEITLYSDVPDKKGWQDKASMHKKSPNVLFIQRPNSSA
jgi:Leucine-rich repeat (LRR) protein